MRHNLLDIKTILQSLDGSPADAIESETLECKPWNPDPKALKGQLRELRETVVCLANHLGGAIVLGIEDRKRSRREALRGVGTLSPDLLRKALYDGTDPHILVEVDELVEPEARLLVVHVPRGFAAHTTTEGVAKIRVGKDCQPLTGSMLARRIAAGGEIDRTAQPVPGATPADLDPAALLQLQRAVAAAGGAKELARLAPDELMENLGLIHGGEVSLAAILLLGSSGALARWAPQQELIFLRYTSRTQYDVRHDLKSPILPLLERLSELFKAHLRLSLVATGDFGEAAVPDLTEWSAREAVLNALVHRDYFLRQSIYVELRTDSVQIISPGGFIGGVAPDNILRHAPVRRNPLITDVLQAAGYVNRVGMGVDRIYEELLRLGKGLPGYEADEATVRLSLPTRTHAAFARFVAEETRKGRPLDLDDLILLRVIADRGHVDRWQAAISLQTSEPAAATQLVSLRERGYLVPRGRGRGTTYEPARAYSDLLRGRLATDDAVPLDDEAVRLRIEAVLRERGRLTNADVRRLSGFSRGEVVRLVQKLRKEGVVALAGTGRGAHYVPGPKLRAGPAW